MEIYKKKLIYKLKNPILLYSEFKGENVKNKEVTLEFKGTKGFVTVKKMQDLIMETILNASKGSDDSSKSEETSKSNSKQDKAEPLSEELVIKMLNLSGKSALIMEVILDNLEDFALLGNVVLDKNLQEELSFEDIEGICEGVLNTFLLPFVIRMLKV